MSPFELAFRLGGAELRVLLSAVGYTYRHDFEGAYILAGYLPAELRGAKIYL